MEKHYLFAGIEITVCIPDDVAYNDDGMLSAFRTNEITDAHRFEFSLEDELLSPEGTVVTIQPGYTVFADESRQIRYFGVQSDPNIRAVCAGKVHQVQVKKSQNVQAISSRTVLNAIALEHLAAQENGFVFHCAYIDYKGEAILFTAPSGTGKSTQAELWAKHRGAQIINGDRAVVRINKGEPLACGIPFAGSSVYCENRSLPIKAVVYLAQAPQTTIRKIRGYEAFSRMWEGVSVNTWNRQDMEAVSHTVATLVECVPIFYMPCTPDQSAVAALEQAIAKWVNQ